MLCYRVPVAHDPSADLALKPVNGDSRTIREWVTNFHLLLVALDPFTNESSWILPTAAKVMGNFTGADVRVAWLCAASADDTKRFLGPLSQEFLTFADPDRTAIAGLGLARLPALVHVRTDLSLAGCAEGWNKAEWSSVCEQLAVTMSWAAPQFPLNSIQAFEGTAAVLR